MKVEAIEESTNAKLAKFLDSVQESNEQQSKWIKEQIATASELNKFNQRKQQATEQLDQRTNSNFIRA